MNALSRNKKTINTDSREKDGKIEIEKSVEGNWTEMEINIWGEKGWRLEEKLTASGSERGRWKDKTS